MLIEINSYSLNKGVIKFYCTEVENIYSRNREFPKEMEFAFDTHNKYVTKNLIIWLKQQKAVKRIMNDSPTWADVLSSVLGTVVNVNWNRYRVFE